MRRLLVSLFAVVTLLTPQAALPPSEAAAQVQQDGLVNVAVDDNNICLLCNVAAAVQAIVQACDLVDVNQAQVLVLQALSTNAPVQRSDCSQATGNQNLTIHQVNEQQRGGGAGQGGIGQAGLVNAAVSGNNVCVGCNVAVAVQAIAQVCDALDVNQIQLLVAQVLNTNAPVQETDCSQATGDQTLLITQALDQRGGGPATKP